MTQRIANFSLCNLHVKSFSRMRFTFCRLGLPYVLIVADLLIPRELEADDVDCGQRAAAVGGRQAAFTAATTAEAVHAVEGHGTHHHAVTLLKKVVTHSTIDFIYFYLHMFCYLNSAVQLQYKPNFLLNP